MSTDRSEYHRYYDQYGRDKKAKKFYSSKSWIKCRETILRRDNYICQMCWDDKKLTTADTVHHIIELRDDWSKALAEENLISLCASCHSKIHSEGNTKTTIRNVRVIKSKGNDEVI